MRTLHYQSGTAFIKIFLLCSFVAAIACLKRAILDDCSAREPIHVMIFHPLCLFSKHRHDLKSLETDIDICRKSIRKEEEKNEMLVTTLSRSQNDNNTTKKLIARCVSKQEALKVETSTYSRVLHETEQTIGRIKMVRRVTWKKKPFELYISI